jgi:hypothetical protein
VVAGESAFTVAALGVGIGFWMAQSTAADRIDRIQSSLQEAGGSACHNDAGTAQPESCRQLTAAIDDYYRARKFSSWGFAGAGIGAAATILTFVLWPNQPVTPRVQKTASATWFGIDGQF